MDKMDVESTQQSAQDAGRTRRWYAWDLSLFGAFAVLYLAFLGIPLLLVYLEARRTGQDSPLSTVVSMGLGLLVAGWLLAMVLRMLLGWPRRIHGLGRLLAAWALTVIGVAVFVLVSSAYRPAGYTVFLRGFRVYVQDHLDVPAIQEWLEAVDPNSYDGAVNEPTQWLKQRSDWPDAILNLDPSYATLTRDKDGRPSLRVGWMAIDAEWGFTIGPATPASREQAPSEGGLQYHDADYRLPLAPGAYVWRNME